MLLLLLPALPLHAIPKSNMGETALGDSLRHAAVAVWWETPEYVGPQTPLRQDIWPCFYWKSDLPYYLFASDMKHGSWMPYPPAHVINSKIFGSQLFFWHSQIRLVEASVGRCCYPELLPLLLSTHRPRVHLFEQNQIALIIVINNEQRGNAAVALFSVSFSLLMFVVLMLIFQFMDWACTVFAK